MTNPKKEISVELVVSLKDSTSLDSYSIPFFTSLSTPNLSSPYFFPDPSPHDRGPRSLGGASDKESYKKVIYPQSPTGLSYGDVVQS
jgi:hypothetical protein